MKKLTNEQKQQIMKENQIEQTRCINTAIQIIRDLSIGKQLVVGKRTIAMGTDLTIGYVLFDMSGTPKSVVGDLTFRNIVQIVHENKIYLVPQNEQSRPAKDENSPYYEWPEPT